MTYQDKDYESYEGIACDTGFGPSTSEKTIPVPACFYRFDPARELRFSSLDTLENPVIKNLPKLDHNTSPSLRALTTMGIGGKAKKIVLAQSQTEFIDAIVEADESGIPLLVLGGGSNLLVADEGFEGIVVRDMRSGMYVEQNASCGGVVVSAPAGQSWDEFVCACIDRDWMGLESLSGIPGTVGAAPVQNIGAYGYEVGQFISAVTVYDRVRQGVRKLPVGDLQLGYRDSIIKRSCSDASIAGERIWGPSGAWIVLEVEFQLKQASLSAPIRYAQLAQELQVQQGERVDLRAVRKAVLQLRTGKGMVLDPADPDTHSAGSFFVNPVLSEAEAQFLPDSAPRYPVYNTALTNPVTGIAPQVQGKIKTSAAWLISNSGIELGFNIPGITQTRVSTKHSLAITNRGEATAADIARLAGEICARVEEKFQVRLQPEPVCVGFKI